MTATQLLQDLRSAGYVLAVNAGKINVRSDKPLTDEARAAIKANREELLQVLEAERIQLVTAREFADELRATGAIRTEPHTPAPTEPEPSDEVSPIAFEDLEGMRAGDLVDRLRVTSPRLAELAEADAMVSPEALVLSAERGWIQINRPEVWRSAYPVKPLPVPVEGLPPIGDMTPPDHLQAIGGRARAEQIFGKAGAYRLAMTAELFEQRGGEGPWGAEYAQAFARLVAGHRTGINPDEAIAPVRPWARGSPITAEPRQQRSATARKRK